jgi:hypothetical protein
MKARQMALVVAVGMMLAQGPARAMEKGCSGGGCGRGGGQVAPCVQPHQAVLALALVPVVRQYFSVGWRALLSRFFAPIFGNNNSILSALRFYMDPEEVARVGQEVGRSLQIRMSLGVSHDDENPREAFWQRMSEAGAAPTATGVLRYPQLYPYLEQVESALPAEEAARGVVEVWGPGLDLGPEHRVFIPQLTELMAALVRYPFVVVDLNPLVAQALPLSEYDYAAAREVIAYAPNYGAQAEQHQAYLTRFVSRVQSRLPLDRIAMVTSAFERLADEPGRARYIFATHSLVYALRDPRAQERLKVIVKVLTRLMVGGTLFIDPTAFIYFVDQMPDFSQPVVISVAGARYAVARLPLLSVGVSASKPHVFLSQGKPYVSTSDLIAITRLKDI